MMLDTRYRTSGPDVVFEDFDGDLVVLNISTGQYYGFNKTAAAAWSALMAGARPSNLAQAGPAAETFAEFVTRLIDLDLIAPSAEPAIALTPEMAEAITAHDEAPKVDVYSDLADLIIADPIHEVDEQAGWPQVSAAE